MRLQHGFSLVEVLVTLLILKVALLGLLAAQTMSLRQLQDAIQRTQAVALSHSLLSELQANRQLANVIGQQLTISSELPPAPDCTPPSQCNLMQIGANQLNNWFGSFQSTGGGNISNPTMCLQSQGPSFLLQMSWQHRSAQSSQDTASCYAATGRSALAVEGGGW